MYISELFKKCMVFASFTLNPDTLSLLVILNCLGMSYLRAPPPSATLCEQISMPTALLQFLF